MRCLLAGLLMLAPAVPLAAQPASPTASGATISAPAVPATLAGLRLSETSIFTNPQQGTQYRYVDGVNLYIDVAVQASPTQVETAGSAAFIINRGVEGFKRLPETTPGGIPRFQVVLDSAYSASLGLRTVPAHVVAARLQRGPQQRYEAWYFFVSGPRYVRVMVNSIGTSTVPEDAPEVRRRVDLFMEALLPALSAAWGL
ncbi:hypothetical protein [Longimicrobium terrae]|uniref:Uncharacterized protein n=1 Tax=Longimicrobium terrae TaxID=1639882 RepID=A0A841GX03_9BACT|nr:hypothetical protein [Longimicrobium terrae]MBB4634751.1 hypothetical protein [Longimicrobium terrae]MBB6069146.1 hypothetical protein [Longimicrobium terrae]NNC32037.1 hypothetical protein [Longimicrobium terrae]